MTTPPMTHVSDSKVRNIISPEVWQTISPSRNAVTIITQMSLRKINTLWSSSTHGVRPTLVEPEVGIAYSSRTMLNFIGSARLGASDMGP